MIAGTPPPTPRVGRAGLGWYLRWFSILLVAGILSAFSAVISRLPGGRSMPGQEAGPEAGSGERTVAAPLGNEDPGESGRREAPGRTTLTAYFPRSDRPWQISSTPIEIPAALDLPERVSALVEALATPPGREDLMGALPQGTRLLACFHEGNRLIVSVSPEVLESRPGGVAVSLGARDALVNSLASLPGIERVRLLVANQEALTFRDHLDLEQDLGFRAEPVVPLEAVPPPQPGASP